jgi:hypothetical protein
MNEGVNVTGGDAVLRQTHVTNGPQLPSRKGVVSCYRLPLHTINVIAPLTFA